ncbi:hypothetical protein ABQW67_03815 [Xanthomonas hortorum]|uniref:Lipoprotein n=2 Tax=Xanthomonas hortorum pv. vitians TaxID=83224 RepID=A0AAW8ZX09_9XANT|nr:hypothetical protein [Xanthomonas hortorum]MCC8492664.1 hypothetical protein [Xanthomonas hortorum pv. gardneri]MCE4280974.1 hypothetical protein [Xanthomonas hortorum pv. vitians]MCE4286348.1 hypothetical protein [Xanthomonas hortorum pv. vitians]MCE4290838.1 hypothetical protein [Xanthomonas hortorum pv. vitians]MCE4294950.1 hypothetical protein [Xanthomonas hortorum pv. vitians]
MNKFLIIPCRILLVAGLLILGACKPEATPAKAEFGVADHAKNPSENGSKFGSKSKNSEGAERMTSLYQVVSLLVAKNGTPWTSFNAIPGVHWRDVSPKANIDSTDPQNAQYRSGILLLDGFAAVDVPDGGQGADEGTKQANEGESGITLNGDAQSVQSIAVKKFYASPEYAEVLKRQLPMAAVVRLIAATCAGDEDGGPDPVQTKFYAIDFEAGQAFVEAYLDDGTETRGPGSTTFVFTKAKPQKRIQALQCKEVK